MLWDKDELSYPLLGFRIYKYMIGVLIPKSGKYYLLIVVGRSIADETLTKRTAGFLPTLLTKWGEPLLVSINDSQPLK